MKTKLILFYLVVTWFIGGYPSFSRAQKIQGVKLPPLATQSFFHDIWLKEGNCYVVAFKRVNKIEELLGIYGFSLSSSGEEIDAFYEEPLQFKEYSDDGTRVKIYIEPTLPNIVDYVIISFETSDEKQRFLDHSEKQGLIKSEDMYYFESPFEYGIRVELTDNNSLTIFGEY